jgi:hypothetical protein
METSRAKEPNMSNKQLAEDLGIVLKIAIDQYIELESAA